jgi:YD repeat-containing protein
MIVAEEVSYMDGSVDIIEYRYSNGQLSEKIQRTEDDEVESKEKFEYEGDLLVRFDRTDYDDQVVYQVVNSYKDGKLAESSISNFEGEQPYKQVVRYNEAGRRIEELRYDKRDRLIERNSFEEDENGRVVRMVEENTARKNTTGMAYDENGRLVKQSETDMRGLVLSDIERSYTEEGLPEATRVLLLDRVTGLHQQYLLVYEYEFYEDL